MGSKKVNLLFIVYDFAQAGGQRHVYEFIKALDKKKFNVTFLSQYKINSSKEWPDYYHPLLQKEGCEFIEYPSIQNQKTIVERGVSFLFRRIVSKIKVFKKVNSNYEAKQVIKEKKDLNQFFFNYDVVNWMGISVYWGFMHKVALNEKHLIHCVSAKFQFKSSPYQTWDKSIHYNFVSGHKPDYVVYEFNEFPKYDHFYFPLSMGEIEGKVKEVVNNKKFKIGMYTRIHPLKPLEPFLYAFHLLLQSNPNVEFHLFGNGQPGDTGLDRQINYLGLNDSVFFHGHQDDIIEASNNEGIQLAWFQGYDNVPGGYAAYELMVAGLPHVFWDFHPGVNVNKKDHVYPSFSAIDQMASYTLELIEDSELRLNISRNQREETLKDHSIENHIKSLEAHFLNVSNK